MYFYFYLVISKLNILITFNNKDKKSFLDPWNNIKSNGYLIIDIYKSKGKPFKKIMIIANLEINGIKTKLKNHGKFLFLIGLLYFVP